MEGLKTIKLKNCFFFYPPLTSLQQKNTIAITVIFQKTVLWKQTKSLKNSDSWT